MFERYTEKARRVIFFARYEASQFGSPAIETEHLLLGLLQEDKRLGHVFLGSNTSNEAIRKKIEQRTTVRDRIPTSLDLPLSSESKRILSFALDEAERLGHNHIGTEHLLVGMLREKSSLAAQLLTDAGVTLEDVRSRIGQVGTGLLAGGPARIRPRPAELDQIREQVSAFKRFVWVQREWKPLDMVVETDSGRVHFDRSLAADPKFQLLPAGWKKEWCAICRAELDAENPEHGTGYTNGREWICPKCHDAFFDPNRKPES